LLCAALLGATWPLLAALPSAPSSILGGDAYVITQGSGAPSVNDSLVQNLSLQSWSQAVSPEILSLGTINNSAVLVRGANFPAFLLLEHAILVQQGPMPSFGVLAGQGLANRLGLRVGMGLTLEGSSVPRIAVAQLGGVFRTNTAANDELVIPFPIARFLTGVPDHWYHEIRLTTANPNALVAFLESFRASVHVTGPSGTIGESHSAPATDPRLVNLFLRGATGALPPAYLAEALTEATNSVQAVAVGLAILVAALVASAIHAVQARGFAERRVSIGIVRSLGAPSSWIVVRTLRESLPHTVLAALSGALSGFLLVSWAGPAFGLRVFGHELSASIDPLIVMLLFVVVVSFSCLSLVFLVASSLRDRPMESVRDETGFTTSRSLEVVLRD
jgi:ABC-type lipoprotein release transport system permease subunit